MGVVKKVERRSEKPRQSLVERAYSRLEEMIVTLQLEPGSVLSEQAMAQDLGIGRTPIREALHRLSNEGLVVILPRKGVLVSDINPKNQLRVLEVRRELERLLARAGAKRHTDEERQALVEIADGMEAAAKTNDDLLFMRLDADLNRLIAQAAHNEYAQRLVAQLNGLSRRFWFCHYKEAADLPLAARLHAELARRIASGDEDGAGEASDRLVEYVETFTRATVLGDPLR